LWKKLLGGNAHRQSKKSDMCYTVNITSERPTKLLTRKKKEKNTRKNMVFLEDPNSDL